MVYANYCIFNEIDSRDFRLMLGSIGDDNEDEINMGLNYDIEQVKVNDKFVDYGASYSDVLRFNMTLFHENGEFFERYQIREIMSWMDCAKDEMKWLTFYDEETEENINYLCRIAEKYKIKNGGNIIGFRFSVVCDSQYAYSDIVSYTLTGEDCTGTHNIFIDSDDTVYPDVSIKNIYGESINKINISIKNNSVDVEKYYDTTENIKQEMKINVAIGKPIYANESFDINTENQYIESKVLNDTVTERENFGDGIFNFVFTSFIPGTNEIVITSDVFIPVITFSYRTKYKVGEF